IKMNDDDVTLIILFLHTTLIASIVFVQRRGTLCLFGRHLGTGEPVTWVHSKPPTPWLASLLVQLCAILRMLGCLPQAPNGTGRMLCPNHHCMCSFGRRSTSVMNFRATDTPTSGSIQEMNRHSLVGWKSTPRLPFCDKPCVSQSSKKEDQAAEATVMPIISRRYTPA